MNGSGLATKMDIQAKRSATGTWVPSDLLGRKLEVIGQSAWGFTIERDEASKLAGIDLGPLPSLDQAVKAVGKSTLGQCRRVAP